MSSTFGGLEVATRALRTSQGVIDVVGHNVANVNTPGYSRQAAEITAVPPDSSGDFSETASGAQFGAGVDLSSVTRAQDQFIQAQLQAAGSDQGRYNMLSDTLQRVQSNYDELGTNGIGKQITSLFNAFQALASTPESDSARSVLRDQAQTVARRFHEVYNGLGQIDQDITSRGQTSIQQANDLAAQVAALNKQIHTSIISGANPNDLADKRDQVISQLGNLIGATSVPEVGTDGKPDGNVRVLVGGFTLVQEDQVNNLPTTFGYASGVPQLTDGNVSIPVRSGEVSGLIEASHLISGYRDGLNQVASKLITQVNQQHKTGYGLDGQTGRDFFSGTDASDIGVSGAVVSSLNAIGASSAPAAGQSVAESNGDNALAIANIASTPLFGTQTLVDYHGAKVTQIGLDAQSYQSQATNQVKVVQQLQTMRDSTSGVSMDEELSHMMQFQRSYQAAARMMTTLDDMLNSLLTAMGS